MQLSAAASCPADIGSRHTAQPSPHLRCRKRRRVSVAGRWFGSRGRHPAPTLLYYCNFTQKGIQTYVKYPSHIHYKLPEEI